MRLFESEAEAKQHLQESASEEYRKRVESWLASEQSTLMIDNGPGMYDIWFRESNGRISVTD